MISSIGIRVQDKSVLNVIEQLLRDKTLVTMRLAKSEFELLTVVTDVRPFKFMKGAMFLVDCTQELKQAIDSIGDWSLEFQFAGSDKVQHRFRTSKGQISGDKIWLVCPKTIIRDQKRNDFRIEVPSGTELQFEKDGINHVMKVCNISMGGLLSTLRKRTESISSIGVQDKFLGAILNFPVEKRHPLIHIEELAVIREEVGANSPNAGYGLQLTAIDSIERSVLRQQLYKWQRKLLRRNAGRV